MFSHFCTNKLLDPTSSTAAEERDAARPHHPEQGALHHSLPPHPAHQSRGLGRGDHADQVTCCRGHMLSWSRVVVVTCCHGYVVSWSRVVLVTCCRGHVLLWSRVVMVTY